MDRLLVVIALALVLVGCQTIEPNKVRVQTTHISHLTAGAPFGARSEEDGLTIVELTARWELKGAFVEVGEGYNVRGRNGGGFYGPAETTSLRLGYEWRLKP